MKNNKMVNGKKIMSGEEFFKKWNAAKERVDNRKCPLERVDDEQFVDLWANDNYDIPLF